MGIDPEDEIRGWLHDDEKLELRRLATGQRVVEFGSYCGKSTVCMARVATHVTAVDTFRGVPQVSRPDSAGLVTYDSEGELLEEFERNIRRCGLLHRVTTVVRRAEDVVRTFDFADIGLVFFDADHSYECTYDCGYQLLRRTPRTCTIAFHDYSRGDRHVMRAVDQLAEDFDREFRKVHTLAIFDGEGG